MSTIRLTGIRTVVFDLDDTLYAERDFAFSGFRAVSRWLESRITCPFDTEKRMRELFETEHRHKLFDQLLKEMGCTVSIALIPEMVACYRNHMPDIQLLPDVHHALTRWRGKFLLGLISDGPLKMQENKVSALGLADLLDFIVLTDAWGREFWKPHERAYELIEQRSDQSGSVCLYIADNPAKDFIAPVRRGWHTIQIRRPGGIYTSVSPPAEGRPEFEIGGFDEVDLSI